MKSTFINITILSLFVGVTVSACGKKGVLGVGAKKETDDGDVHAVLDPRPTPRADSTCTKKKTNAELITSLTQDIFRRSPSSIELKAGDSANFNFGKYIDESFKSSEYDKGVGYFISNLFRLEQNLKLDPNLKDDAAVQDAILVDNLKQEPIEFVLRNKDKPWPYFFIADEIPCSPVTAPLYDFPADPNVRGFASRCKLPPERAGFLGLVSFLRGFPSAFYVVNKNRHRVAATMYLIEGIQLAAATNGPTGGGSIVPLPACAPTVDVSVSTSGQIFGTAAVPMAGSTCSNCHSKILALMEPAFTIFDMKGKIMKTADIDALNDNMLEGISKTKLKQIFEGSGKSCFAVDNHDGYPEDYNGLPGLARLVGKSKTKLAEALAIQIQQNLVNKAPEPKTTEAIVKAYNANGQTLQSALKGFFLSDSYQCAVAQ